MANNDEFSLQKVQQQLSAIEPTIRALQDRAKQYVHSRGGMIRRKKDGKVFKFCWVKLSPLMRLVFEGYPVNMKTGKYSERRAHCIGGLMDIEIAMDVKDGGPSE
jgi:hypothetical protein